MKFNHELFKELLMKELGENSIVEFERFIEDGELIPMEVAVPDGISIIKKYISSDPAESIIQLELFGDTTEILNQFEN